MVNKNIKISVLIPVYNSEGTLKRCIKSVQNQTFKDIEIILINDGSTDNSLKIIKECAKSDDRIKIINKKNTGYGDSLNHALEIAQGNYIGIVESDDYIQPNMYKILYKNTYNETIDVVKSKYKVKCKSEIKKVHKFNKLINKIFKEIPKSKIFTANEYKEIFYLMPSIWSSIYNRTFLEKYNLKFICTPKASYQDRSFIFQVYAKARSILFVDQCLYCYCPSNKQSPLWQNSVINNFIQEIQIYFYLINNNLFKKYLDVYIFTVMQDIDYNFKSLNSAKQKELLNYLSVWFSYIDVSYDIPYDQLDNELTLDIKRIIDKKLPKFKYLYK